MVQPQKRPPLPAVHNYMLDPQNSPDYQSLVDKRRLGQTNFQVKPGQVGNTSATRSKNLGLFDYAHLRAPLPPDLVGTELFQQGHPLDSYFLMRRSSDGYVSATGMFKVAFPWATTHDEETEKKYLKSLPTTSDDEIAGNVWLTPIFALELAEQYKMQLWIRALLDPAPIVKGTETKKPIAHPPTFILPEETATDSTTPAPTSNTGRGRGRLRSSSPGRATQATRKIASPRKRTTKNSNAAASVTNANAMNATLQSSVDDSTDNQSVTEKVHVEVDAAVDINGNVDSEHTTVKVDVLSGRSAHTEPPGPDEAAEMLATAQRMVEGARKIDGILSHTRATKRKADELDEDDDEDILAGPPTVKETRVLRQQLKTERVKTKALLGLSATLAVGAVVPYLL
ncbi:MAG: hypothetical protein M1816_003592 [Peltula sp. TS41687]|nr:MAG: hypothetical protein M1816_003592 [Peltula sp. TS41687]